MVNPFDADYHSRGARWAGSVDYPSLKKTDVILETGCGNGKTLQPLLDAGHHVIGIDIAREAILLSGGSYALIGDIRSLPFSENTFDVVFCRHVLGHLSEQDRMHAAEELLRVTKPNGKIYFSGFSCADFRYGSGREIEPHSFLKGDGIMTHYFSEEELRAYFVSCTISIEEEQWGLRVRGMVYPRSELRAIISKSIHNPAVRFY